MRIPLCFRLNFQSQPLASLSIQKHHARPMNTQIQIFFRRNKAYVAIESCLGSKSTDHAAHLHGAPGKKSQSLVFGIEENEVLVHVFDVEVVEFKLFSFHPSPLKPSPNLITLQLQGSSTLIFLKKAQYIFIKKHFAFGSFLQ